MRRLLPTALALTALAGCGGDAGPTSAAAPTPTPTPASTPAAPGSAANAFIGSMAVDPADGTLYLGTGLGLFRVPPGGEPRRVVGTLDTPQGSGEVSSNLVIRFAGPGELLASGHPERPDGGLPEDLGLIRSTDRGRTWEPVAELGEADHHLMQVTDAAFVAVDVEEPGVRVSADGGRTFEVRSPPSAPLDVVVDPADPEQLALAAADGVYTSADGGSSWRQRDAVPADQLAWADDGLYRVDPGGLVSVSTDGGRTWEDRGTVDLSADELAAAPDGTLYASVAGGEVRRSDDGGARWETHVILE